MTKIGIVLAGGKSERWGGYPKEMLPIGNGMTLLDRTIDAMHSVNVDKIYLVTSEEKIEMHMMWLKSKVDYLCRESNNLFEVILDTLNGADNYYFAMPDTCYPQDAMINLLDGHFNIGYFDTNMPERFGVINEHGIADKMSMPHGVYPAWGILSWDKEVVDLWKQNINKIKSHTDAFNMAINEFGFTMSHMDYYYDMASFKDYREFLCSHM